MGWLTVRWVLQPRWHGEGSTTWRLYDVWPYHHQHCWRSSWIHPVRRYANLLPTRWNLPRHQRLVARERKIEYRKVESKSWVWKETKGKGRLDEGDPCPSCFQRKGCWHHQHPLWIRALQAKAGSVSSLLVSKSETYTLHYTNSITLIRSIIWTLP